MYGELCDILEAAARESTRLRIVDKEGATFTGIPECQDEGDDDLGWFFIEVKGSIYPNIHLKDIASVYYIDHPEICWTAPIEA